MCGGVVLLSKNILALGRVLVERRPRKPRKDVKELKFSGEVKSRQQCGWRWRSLETFEGKANG